MIAAYSPVRYKNLCLHVIFIIEQAFSNISLPCRETPVTDEEKAGAA